MTSHQAFIIGGIVRLLYITVLAFYVGTVGLWVGPGGGWSVCVALAMFCWMDSIWLADEPDEELETKEEFAKHMLLGMCPSAALFNGIILIGNSIKKLK